MVVTFYSLYCQSICWLTDYGSLQWQRISVISNREWSFQSQKWLLPLHNTILTHHHFHFFWFLDFKAFLSAWLMDHNSKIKFITEYYGLFKTRFSLKLMKNIIVTEMFPTHWMKMSRFNDWCFLPALLRKKQWNDRNLMTLIVAIIVVVSDVSYLSCSHCVICGHQWHRC